MTKFFKKMTVFASVSLLSSAGFAQALQPWASPEVVGAWISGYRGQGTTITVIDDFKSNSRLLGNFTGYLQSQQHGAWTSQEANLIAPSAKIAKQDFTDFGAVKLSPKGLNVLNASYGIFTNSGYSLGNLPFGAREQSIINYARNGAAVVAKAAGNDYGTAVGSGNSKGETDYLNLALIDTKSAIFVGALDKNGTSFSKASIAKYSNIAGSNPLVQEKFLVVGVTGGGDSKYKLYGTSFAAPIVSGYSAILGSKFTTSDATKIANKLLTTARVDTIAGYNPSIHGRGEASIARALAPVAIK